MKNFILIALCLFSLSACKEEAGSPQKMEGITTPLVITTAEGAEHKFNVELALTPAEQAKGLMNRTEMASDHGMLFWFGIPEAPRAFWMKNTLISLDMIFIRADGRIHHIHHSAKPNDLTSIKSQGPAAAVLELNGGVSKLLGLKPGDVVHHKLFGNVLAP